MLSTMAGKGRQFFFMSYFLDFHNSSHNRCRGNQFSIKEESHRHYKHLVTEVQAQPEDLLKHADSHLGICRGVSGTPNAIMSKQQVSPWFQFDNRALSSNLW